MECKIERVMGGFQHGLRTAILWKDLVGIEIGGTIGFIAFFSFPKGTIIEAKQTGTGLGQTAYVYQGRFSLVLDWRPKGNCESYD